MNGLDWKLIAYYRNAARLKILRSDDVYILTKFTKPLSGSLECSPNVLFFTWVNVLLFTSELIHGDIHN